MLTLPPKRRGREQAACWQLLRFAAGLTRPDGTSARVFRQPSPVETTHPHRPNQVSGARILHPATQADDRADRLRRPVAWRLHVASGALDADHRLLAAYGCGRVDSAGRHRDASALIPQPPAQAGTIRRCT